MDTIIRGGPDRQIAQPWNKGKLTGAKPPFRPKHVWAGHCQTNLSGPAKGAGRAVKRRQVHGKRRGPPSQGWRTFLRNHAPNIAAMDLFVVPTIGFDLLYALVIVRLDRRDLVWINVTANPTAEWIARQSEHIGRWTKMRRSLAPFSGPELLVHTRSLADFITTTSGFRFSVHTTPEEC